MKLLATIAGAALLLGLAACSPASAPPVATVPGDPAVVAKINYVCVYSGAFEFADRLASSVIPVPGVALGVNLLNAGVDQVCLHPDTVAATEATVASLIGQFKSAGKM